MSKTDLMRQIRDEILALQESPLYEYRTSNNYFPVIGEGSHDARIMFVGEAPGKNEAKTGRPFCGAAGKVLDQLLAHVNIDRASVYVTNIVKDRPPENRDPTTREIEVYGPFLDRQFDIIRPRVIVALGRYSMGYIMKKFDLDLELEPISRAHGKMYRTTAPWKDAAGQPAELDIVVLYHPCVGVYDPRKINELKKDFDILKQFQMEK